MLFSDLRPKGRGEHDLCGGLKPDNMSEVSGDSEFKINPSTI
jgi:hypothetical protein